MTWNTEVFGLATRPGRYMYAVICLVSSCSLHFVRLRDRCAFSCCELNTIEDFSHFQGRISRSAMGAVAQPRRSSHPHIQDWKPSSVVVGSNRASLACLGAWRLSIYCIVEGRECPCLMNASPEGIDRSARVEGSSQVYRRWVPC